METRRTRTIIINVPISFTVDEATTKEAIIVSTSFINNVREMISKSLDEINVNYDSGSDIRRIKVLEIS